MAKFNSAWLISKRQFRSLTGIETGTLRALVDRLRPHWRERIVAPKNRPGRPWSVGGLEDHLLVLLILYRCAITQDFMACLYRTDKSTVSRSLQRIEALLPRDAHVYADSGYQGLQGDHSGVEFPYKKTKARPLTKEERAYNHALSRFRVRGEHGIARLKSFRILSERYRYPKARYAVKISIVAGIINIAAGF